ncbi:MAG: EamA family transporter [Chlorobiales bacterium]|nr:EamA family transporter [Chlorobiales bacterium]
MQTIVSLNWISLVAILYLALAATLFGFGAWSKLLTRYPAGIVAPLSLLVPITGLLTARVFLGEQLSVVQWCGCLIVIGGLLVFNYRSRTVTPLSQDRK